MCIKWWGLFCLFVWCVFCFFFCKFVVIDFCTLQFLPWLEVLELSFTFSASQLILPELEKVHGENTSQRQGLFLWFLSFSGSSICNILLPYSMGSQGEAFVYLSFPSLPKIEANIMFAKTLFSYILCLIKI